MKSKAEQRSAAAGQRLRQIVFFSFLFVVAVTVAMGLRFALGKPSSTPGQATKPVEKTPPKPTNAELPSMEISTAVMVTVELDFGPNVPTIAEALPQIERRYEPADGVGRTFAILDAYGEQTADHKLHMSMHVSSEKPGVGALIFRRTGEVLWKSKIIMGYHTNVPPLSKRNLLILVDNGSGKSFTIDGSNNPRTILDANVKEASVPLNVIWADGTEHEFTYIYSACGCPVKALVRRVGDTTVRAKELPVMFPDDPAVMGVINGLMGWK